MTPQEMKTLDKWLAEKVMGWTIIDDLHIKDGHGNYVFDGSPWHPTTSIEQAMMCAKQVGFCLTLYIYSNRVYTMFDTHESSVIISVANGENAEAEAISLAIRAAVEK